MRILAWNVNHRTTQKRIPPDMAVAIGSLSPDVVVLTEYVPGPSREQFIADIDAAGLSYILTSLRVPGQNSVLIASRMPIEAGHIHAPAIAPALPSNVLHVHLPESGIDVLGLRIPDYSGTPALRRACWDWIQEVAREIHQRPSTILGDLNTDPTYSPARCGDRFARMEDEGWHHAKPPGSSYWTLKGGLGKQLDHAFFSPHFRVLAAEYVREFRGFTFAGANPGAMSDHAALLVTIEDE